MRTPKALLRDYLEGYPLSDRITFVYDVRGGASYGVLAGVALPLVGVVGRRLGMDSAQLALLMGSQYIGFLLNLATGHLARSGDLRAQVFWPAFLARAALALVALAFSPLAFLAILVFYYVVSNLTGPAYSTIMRLNYSDAHRGRAMGQVRIVQQVIAALCAALAGAYLQAFPEGYRLVFPLGAVAGMASSLFFLKVKPRKGCAEGRERPAAAEGFGDSLRELRRDRPFLVYMAIVFIAGFPDKLMTSLEPIRLVDELGAGYGAAGLVLGTVPLAAAVLGYFLCAKLSDRIDPIFLLVGTVILSSTRYLGLALASVPAHLLPGSFLNGVSNAGWDLLPLFSVLLFAERSKVGLYMGFYNALIGLRGLVGPALGTWLYEGAGMRIADIYWIAFGIEAASVILLAAFWASFRHGSISRKTAA
jgi:hypothetical protein